MALNCLAATAGEAPSTNKAVDLLEATEPHSAVPNLVLSAFVLFERRVTRDRTVRIRIVRVEILHSDDVLHQQ